MRKFIILGVVIFTAISASAQANYPYKPKPIIFIHGYNGNSTTWGVKPYDSSSDTIAMDSLETGSTYDRFLNYMNTYAIVYDSLVDESYTNPYEAAYPNKTFLEIINFRHELGSFDPDAGGGWRPHEEQEGWGTELRKKLKKTLKEYYGSNWASDTVNNKVVLIAFSGGGLGVRQALTEAADETPDLRDHVELVVTTATPHQGTPFMDVVAGDIWMYVNLFWVPYMEFWDEPSFGTEPFPLAIYNFVTFPLEALGGHLHLLLDVLGSVYTEKYTDAGMDLGTRLTCDFAQRINSASSLEKQSIPEYRVIVSELSINKSGRGAWIAGASGVVTGVQVALYLAQFNFAMAGLKAGSYITFCYYLNESDLAVYDWSQNPKRYTDILPVTDVIRRFDKFRGEETKDFKAIRNALESPPTLDSMLLTTRLEDSTESDTTFLTPNTIDTVIGNLDSVSVNFKINDVYFLSQTNIKININGVSSGGINYPEETSLTARV